MLLSFLWPLVIRAWGQEGEGAVHRYWSSVFNELHTSVCLDRTLTCERTRSNHNPHNHHKVSELKGAPVLSVSRFGGVTSSMATATWQSDHDLWDEKFGGRIRSCRVRSLPLYYPKVSGTSFTGFTPVDDDMVGNWTSCCTCWTYPEHISIHQLCVDCTSLRRRKTQHLVWWDNILERSTGRAMLEN